MFLHKSNNTSLSTIIFLCLISNIAMGMEQVSLYDELSLSINTNQSENHIAQLQFYGQTINQVPYIQGKNIIQYNFEKIPQKPEIINNQTFFITRPFKCEQNKNGVVQRFYEYVLHIIDPNKQCASYVLHPKNIDDHCKGRVSLFEPDDIQYPDTFEYITLQNGQWVTDPNPEKIGDASTLGDIPHLCPKRGLGKDSIMSCTLGSCDTELQEYSFKSLLFVITTKKIIKNNGDFSIDRPKLWDEIVREKTIIIKGIPNGSGIKFFYHSFPKNDGFFGENFFIHNDQLVSKYARDSSAIPHNVYTKFVPKVHPFIISNVEIIKSYYGNEFFEKIDLANKQLTGASMVGFDNLSMLVQIQSEAWQEMHSMLHQKSNAFVYKRITPENMLNEHKNCLRAYQEHIELLLSNKKNDSEQNRLYIVLLDKIKESQKALDAASCVNASVSAFQETQQASEVKQFNRCIVM